MSRWVKVVFRLGTVLISIGLALFLVSLIPSGQTETMSAHNWAFPETWQPYYGSSLSPQLGIHVKVSGNASFTVYILQVTQSELYARISQQNLTYYSNVTVLQAYLDANPSAVAREDQGSSQATLEYNFVPSDVINATLVVANPGQDTLLLSLEWNMVIPFGPSSVVVLSVATLLVGLVLILPGLRDILSSRKRKSGGSRMVDAQNPSTPQSPTLVPAPP